MEELLKNIKENLDELKANNDYLNEIKTEKNTKENDIKEKQKEIEFLTSGDLRREIKQHEIEAMQNEIQNLDNTIKEETDKIKQNTSDKKEVLKKQVKEKIKIFRLSSDIEKMNDEIENAEKIKQEYEKKALEAKKIYSDEIDKQKLGKTTDPVSSLSKISKAKNEEKKYLTLAKSSNEDILKRKEEVSQYKSVEENEQEYGDLQYLLMHINKMGTEKIESFEKFIDEIYDNYKEEPEEIVEEPEEEAEKQEEKQEEVVEEQKNPSIAERAYNTARNTHARINQEELQNGEKRKKFEELNSKVLVTINEGKLQYQYENDDNSTRKFEIPEIKENISEMKKVFKNIYDPYLNKFLSDNNDKALLATIFSSLSYSNDLENLNNRLKYNMAGAEDLGFKARRQLRKLVKIVKKNGLNIENEDSIKFSIKNDILKGLGNLFRGAMKGLAGGRTETQALLEASKQNKITESEKEELVKREGLETDKTEHDAFVESLSEAANTKETNKKVNTNYNFKHVNSNDEIATTNNEVQNNDKAIDDDYVQ